MSGIKGLQGVVRKTVNDELQANIWDPQHMDKIVPSLLFNLQHVEEAERWGLCRQLRGCFQPGFFLGGDTVGCFVPAPGVKKKAAGDQRGSPASVLAGG